MNIYLTFDIEMWCNDWQQLDSRFAKSFERYYIGASRHGEYALPKTLEIMNRHDLKGVFFVEPLFAARFGLEYLQKVVNLIQEAGQRVDLHIHPEWVDELPSPPIENAEEKRQHLCYYTCEEQFQIISYGIELLRQAGAAPVHAFRAGSFACNRDTFRALERANIFIDSSINPYYEISARDLGSVRTLNAPSQIGKVLSVPTANFRDARGHQRSAQISGASFEELRDAMNAAQTMGWGEFVLVSHNFEMLKPGRSEPDLLVVNRFKRLCAYLDRHRERLPTCTWMPVQPTEQFRESTDLPTTSLYATGRRYVEQAWRKMYDGNEA